MTPSPFYFVIHLGRARDRKPNVTRTLETLSPRAEVFEAAFGTFGTLACFLSKFRCLEEQVRRGIDHCVILEDDLAVEPGFDDVMKEACGRLDVSGMDFARLLRWGEGYVLTLAGTSTTSSICSATTSRCPFSGT